MLSKRKKRIAALITAVVLSVTAAFSLPENIRAEEVTATNSDADAETAEDEGLQEGGIAVQDLADQGETLYIHSRYWDGWYLSSYVDITATDYTPSLHGALKETDASGRETEAYCMQSTKSSAKSDTAYKEGRQWLSDRDTAADIALLMFAYGGRRADPNSGDGRNTQDGGTYGTYIIDGKPVMGIMVAGHVYPMTQDEARALTQAAVHSTVSDCDIRAVRGKVSGESVNSAFSHLRSISDNARRWYDQYKDFKVVGNYIDATAAYNPEQTITTQVYNAAKKTWEIYKGSELTDGYKDASGNVTFRVVYSSTGMCNKLLTNASSGVVTVKHSGTKLNVNGTNYYDYLTISADASNQATFTADYGALTSTTRTIKDTFTNTDITQHVFGQTVTITASYKDMQGKKLALTAKTGTGASHTKYYGDGDKNGVSNYAARIFKNTSYQDACFASPNESLSKSASVTATAQGTGSIKIHKYSASPEITNGNSCYSLKGAEFGIFKTMADAQAGKNAVATITTDANGNGSVGNLAYGTYYVKETKASPGYRINNNVYREKVDSDIPVAFDVPEEAGNDPASVLVQKKDSNGTIFLEGCIFAIKYYDVQMDTDPAQAGKSAVRAWYIKTNDLGKADIGDSKCIQKNSDPLYYDNYGVAIIPLGTITVQEIQAPEGYVLDDTIHTFRITDNPDGIPHINVENDRTISNLRMKQPFELVKLAEGRKDTTYPLAEAGFMACRTDALTEVAEDYEAGEDEEIVIDDAGKYYIWDASKAIALTSDNKTEMFTDEDGYAKSIPLEYGKYIVKETTVPHNFHPIKEFTVNISQNSDEPVKMGYFTDKSFKAYIRIIKKDDKTDKKILSDAATFKIWSYDDNDYVSFDVTAEDGSTTKVSEFKTKDGELMTPGTLMPGKYRIEESECPNGYYNKLQTKSYDITIDADAVYKIYETPEGQVTDMGVFEYEIDNTSLQGTIKINKNGEKRIYNETTKEFETSTVKLAGITFKVYADEDILAQDGSGDTVYLKDTLVDTIVTDQDGNAATTELPLGKYRLEEETPAEYEVLKPVKVILSSEGDKTVSTDEDGNIIESIKYEVTINNKLITPDIHTTAKDAISLTHNGRRRHDSVIIDTVDMNKLIIGSKYRLEGVIMSYETKNPFLTENGSKVIAAREFTADETNMAIDVTYPSIDTLELLGKSLVCFERLYQITEDGEILVAVHENIEDKGQTVTYDSFVGYIDMRVNLLTGGGGQKATTKPKTGDPTRISLILGAALLSGCLIFSLIYRKKKEDKRHED